MSAFRVTKGVCWNTGQRPRATRRGPVCKLRESVGLRIIAVLCGWRGSGRVKSAGVGVLAAGMILGSFFLCY